MKGDISIELKSKDNWKNKRNRCVDVTVGLVEITCVKEHEEGWISWPYESVVEALNIQSVRLI